MPAALCLQRFDEAAVLWCASLRWEPLTWLMKTATELNQHAWTWGLAAVWIAWLVRRMPVADRPRLYRAAAFLGAAIALTDGLASGVLKPLVGRPRPFIALPQVWAGVDAGRHSFPSSHAANTFAAAAFLALEGAAPWVRWLAACVTLVESASRVYLGVHYPSDVLGGWLVGGAVAFLVWRASLLPAPATWPRPPSGPRQPGQPRPGG